ncbi:MAG: hypothetical protein P8009_01690 [Gammaproteobacteria bacterium]
MNRTAVLASLFTVLLFGAASAARAGLIITQVEKQSDSHKTTKSTLYIEGNRMAVRAEDGTGMIFDGDKQTSWNFDTHRKYYVKMTAAEMKAMVAKSKAMADKMMKEQLKHMSPKVRKQMLAEMKKEKKGPTYKKTGSVRRVGKWKCTPVAKYSSDGEQQDQMCVATFEELGITAGDRKVFRAMNRFIEAAGSGDDCDGCSSSGILSKRAEQQLGFRGLPVEEGDNFTKTTLVSIRHGAVPASVFKLPAGLKERKMPGM